QSTFGRKSGYPDLCVLDSTHPDAVRAIEKSVDLAHALFLVSSKSGTTIEPNSYMKYFWERVNERSGTAARQFVAITDPGTAMVKEAQDRKFRRIFETVPDVGGRYSALTHFGLVPAALIGVDVARFLEVVRGMANACGAAVPAAKNPG